MHFPSFLRLTILMSLAVILSGQEAINNDSSNQCDRRQLRHVESLKIGAFNVQSFGRAMMRRPKEVAILLEILSRYDLVLIQEIRDITQTALESLVIQLNNANKNRYGYVVSARLGRSRAYKEQYAYLYRADELCVAETWLYSDAQDVYSRDPFIARFLVNSEALDQFVVVGLHTAPDETPRELMELDQVAAEIRDRKSCANIIMMGDFNADCGYANRKELKAIRDEIPRFKWLISDDEDTTVSRTVCAYDRIIVSGEALKRASPPEFGGSVFRFDKVINFASSQVTPKQISDHYPVEVDLNLRKQLPTQPPPPIICSTEEERARQRSKMLDNCGAMPAVTSLLVGAFNIQRFGVRKMTQTPQVEILLEILRRYDLILIQEIVDKSGKAINQLLNQLQIMTGEKYRMTVSPRLGRSTRYMEQYAYIYRADKMCLLEAWVYDDGPESAGEDEFMREPYVGHFALNSDRMLELVFVGLHTQPSNTDKELMHLDDVVKWIREDEGVSNIMIMGDMNAGGSSATISELNQVESELPKFKWLIDDNADTMVATGRGRSAYDRILVSGCELRFATPAAGKGSVFRFDNSSEINFPTDMAPKSVSDHYPVEVNLILNSTSTTTTRAQERGTADQPRDRVLRRNLNYLENLLDFLR